MNKMKDVAVLLGVQLNEEFKIDNTSRDGYRDIYYCALKEDGLYFKDTKVDQSLLTDIIAGKIEIIKLPFKPKHGEFYWTLLDDIGSNDLHSHQHEFIGTTSDYKNYYLGLCFRTKEEAEANKDKLIKIVNYYKEK